MSTMPHWLAKTPEMIAMDRWFSKGPDLVDHYNQAISSINASKQNNSLPKSSAAMNNRLPGGATGASDAFRHFGTDWLNPHNPSSGGNFWPHVPTFAIISWFQEGVLNAARKGLGWTAIASRGESPDDLFKSELDDSKLDQSELDGELPLVTTWVCTSPPGTGTIEVDALRGPTVVELIIATPQPQLVQSRISSEVRRIIDRQWIILHGGDETVDQVEHEAPA
jgi:hypothetical protein